MVSTTLLAKILEVGAVQRVDQSTDAAILLSRLILCGSIISITGICDAGDKREWRIQTSLEESASLQCCAPSLRLRLKLSHVMAVKAQ